MLIRKNKKHNPKRNNISLLLTGCILIIFLIGCKGDDKKKAVQPPPQKSAPAPAATGQQKPQTQISAQPAAQQDVKKEPEKGKTEEKPAEKKEYIYDPTGKRDPFRSAILGEGLIGKETLPPLQRREISELRLIGIVWIKNAFNAMLETPDGKGYTIKVGTIVGPKKGIVKKITKRTVLIEEKYMDIIGEMKTREVIMELPTKEVLE